MHSKSEKEMKLQAEEQKRDFLKQKREDEERARKETRIGCCATCGARMTRIPFSEWQELKNGGFEISQPGEEVEIYICENERCASVTLEKGQLGKILEVTRTRGLLGRLF